MHKRSTKSTSTAQLLNRMPMSVNQERTAPIPSTGKTTTQPFDIKSFIRNIFHANPAFARFCANVVISREPNSAAAKYLAERYQIFRGVNMPIHPNVKVCTHIKVTGVRCGSPALRGEQFCYFHQRMLRGVQVPPNARLHPVALIENEEAIQASLMEVINAIARNTIDLRRADLMLKALHIAVKNAHRVRFDSVGGRMVHQVPDYPAPPKPAHSVPETTMTASAIETAPAAQTGYRNQVDPTQRKPPVSSPTPPKERKNAARA
jgi:hypothetical protein